MTSLDFATQKLVLADYLNQWSTPQTSGAWDSWSYHQCGISDTPHLTSNGIWTSLASIYYPLIGPYDASDDAVVEYHIRLAQASGIDAFVVDWDGITGFYDFPHINANFREMLRLAELHGFGVAIDYDAMRYYVGHTGPGVSLIPDRKLALQQVHDDLAYAIKQFGPSPSYLKFRGVPVIFVFGAGGGALTRAEWGSIITKLSNEGVNAYYVDMQGQVEKLYPYFNGYFPWMGAGVENIPSDSVSFIDDWVRQLQRYSNIRWGLGVWAGFDNSAVNAWCAKDSSGKYWIQRLDRQNGLVYNQTWMAALKNKPSFVFIVTWNDWNEATIIEPSVQFGYRYLEATAFYSAKFKNEKPSYAGIPVPYALYNATLAVRQAQTDGRIVGLDAANQTLQQAEQAFQSEQYSDATTLAKQAIMLAHQTTTSTTSSSNSYTLSMPQPPVSSTHFDATYAVVAVVVVVLVAASVIALARKRETEKK
jgi:hypothetical protein